MTEERLNELEKLCEAATDGPWEFDTDGCCYSDTVGNPPVLEPVQGSNINVTAPNTAFIAEVRTALPELLKEVHKQKKITQAFKDANAAIQRDHKAEVKHLWKLINELSVPALGE